MKKILLLFVMLIGLQFTFGQVKIGDNFTQVSKYSLLELESKTRGLLLPRMSNEERDRAFNQETPEGMLIFNTDTQMLQYFYFPITETTTGKRADEKTWNTAGEEIYTSRIPPNPNPGDLFYNEVTNILYVWDDPESLWIPINSRTSTSGSESGVSDPTLTTSGTLSGSSTSTTSSIEEVIVGAGVPSSASINSQPLGTLYANTSNGDLYVAIDRNNDGTADTWDKVNSGGGGGSTGPTGPAGPAGPAGPTGAAGGIGLTGPSGPAGIPGTGIVSGTGNPIATSATPTAGNVYIDQTTGGLWTVSGTTWTQQGSDNLGNHTATQNLNLDGYSIQDNTGATGTTGQILSRSTTGTLWIDAIRVLSDVGTPTSLTASATTASATAGDLYVDQLTGEIWTVSGTIWVQQQGTDNLGNHTATQNLNLDDYSIVDSAGVSGTTGQILSRSTTGTLWIDAIRVLSDVGTPTSLTASATTASATAGDLYVDQLTGEIWTVSGTIWVQQGGENIYSKDDTFTASRIATLSSSNTLTFGGTASNTVIYNTNIRLNEALLDSDGNVGKTGQVLTSTGIASNTVKWIYPGGVLALKTGSYSIAEEGSLYVRPSGTVIITLPDPTGDDGRKVTVKRADQYTSGNTLSIQSTASKTIDGSTSLNLNMSYQGYTFEAFGNEWHIIQRF